MSASSVARSATNCAPVASAKALAASGEGSQPLIWEGVTTPARIAPSTRAPPIFPQPMTPSFMWRQTRVGGGRRASVIFLEVGNRGDIVAA